jgi:hypothetical protein
MIDKAIKKINPNAKFTVNAEDYKQITWLDGTTPISKADIEAKIIELQTDYNSKEYQRDRAKEYPPMADQLDDIFHNGINSWKASIQIIKDKYPKE